MKLSDLCPYIYTWATKFLNLGAQMATAYKSSFLSLDKYIYFVIYLYVFFKLVCTRWENFIRHELHTDQGL
jgi:hypothetical protein